MVIARIIANDTAGPTLGSDQVATGNRRTMRNSGKSIIATNEANPTMPADPSAMIQ